MAKGYQQSADEARQRSNEARDSTLRHRSDLASMKKVADSAAKRFVRSKERRKVAGGKNRRQA
jgi:hypothetical protein